MSVSVFMFLPPLQGLGLGIYFVIDFFVKHKVNSFLLLFSPLIVKDHCIRFFGEKQQGREAINLTAAGRRELGKREREEAMPFLVRVPEAP